MLTIVIVAAFFTAFEFLSVLGKFSPTWMKRALGYEWAIDIVMSFGMMAFFAMTGSITGIIISAVTGFIFSISLFVAAKTMGYQKYEKVNGKRQWVEYPPEWSWETLGSGLSKVGTGCANAVKGIVAGMRAANDPKVEAAA